MRGTVNVLFYKSKVLSDGSHPLMICIYKDGKRKYKSIGISVLPQFWDFDKNRPKKNCPDREAIQKIISDKITEYSEQILEYKVTQKEFTAAKLIGKVDSSFSKITVGEFINKEIIRLKSEKRLKSAIIYKELYSSVLVFYSHLDIYFSDIDIDWLKGYGAFLKKRGLSENSMGVRFRTLRAIYNKAIEKRIVKYEYYPFRFSNRYTYKFLSI